MERGIIMIYRVAKKENFVVLDKAFLNDEQLSWKAKGCLPICCLYQMIGHLVLQI